MERTLPSSQPLSRHSLFILPLLVLILTRLGAEIAVVLLPLKLAWLPAFLVYYVCIYLSVQWARRKGLISLSSRAYTFRPVPPVGWLLLGVILPALIPLGVFTKNISAVSLSFFGYILLFSLINPWFEEVFWRQLLFHLPGKKWVAVLYSAGLFSFSHYFFWGSYWFNSWLIIIPTVISTFIMGVLWMLFYQKTRQSMYLIISHFFVDVFNLSVAIYVGIDLPGLPQ